MLRVADDKRRPGLRQKLLMPQWRRVRVQRQKDPARLGHAQQANHVVDARRQVQSDHRAALDAVMAAQMESEAIGGLVQCLISDLAISSANRLTLCLLRCHLFEHAVDYRFRDHTWSSS